MTLTELGSVEPGDPLGAFRYNAGAAVIDSTINEGIAPQSSSLAAGDAEAYVAIDDTGREIAAVGLEHIHDGQAELGIESRRGSIENNPTLMRSVIRSAMKRSGVTVGTLDSELVDMLDIPEDRWKEIGFLPDSSGNYTFIGS
jgi:hypothetical protein